jgi:hypothetical protein
MGSEPKTKRGPEPRRLVIQGDWEDAVGTALRKPPPSAKPATDSKPKKKGRGK